MEAELEGKFAASFVWEYVYMIPPCRAHSDEGHVDLLSKSDAYAAVMHFKASWITYSTPSWSKA